MYLHYRWETESLEDHLSRTYRQAVVAEMRVEEFNRQIAHSQGKQVERLKRECKVETNRLKRYDAQIERIEEELFWRTDRKGLIEFYHRNGYKLVYLCGHGEFNTEGEAIAEARALHLINDARREIGPDGSWIEDMVAPEDMIQVAFVRSKAR